MVDLNLLSDESGSEGLDVAANEVLPHPQRSSRPSNVYKEPDLVAQLSDDLL